MTDEIPMEKINQRRRQMHLHSTIYYHMHTTSVDDATFDKWAVELAELQEKYPESKVQGYMPSVFADWTGDTGMHLPVTDAIFHAAERHLEEARKRGII